MKCKIFLSTSLCVCLNVLTLYAQQENTSYVPPSPNAASLAKHANIPVSLYSGTAKIDVPIVALQSRQGSIPVSLSYHSSGIKVQDIASSVGLGWTLNSGGAITRVVRGLPDDGPEGYCGVNLRGRQAGNELSHEHLKQVATGVWDSEPDVFYFNFLGKTGRFILDENGNPVLTPYQDLDIQPAIGPRGNGKWTITDGDGTIYVFGLDDASRETTVSKLSHQEADKAKTFVSSWYLSQIRGSDHIVVSDFIYTAGSALNYVYYQQIKTSRLEVRAGNNEYVSGPSQGGVRTENIELSIPSPKYISKISNTYGSIEFTYNTNRLDLANGYSLKEITLKNAVRRQILGQVRFGNIVESFSFSYDYFSSNDCQDDQLCKRLYLDKITRASLPYRKFGYSSINLPARNSPQIDHWGYYNSNSYVNSIPEEVYNEYTYEGANREADASRSLANILTSITNELQGTTRLVYGLHTYHDAATNATKLAGGARIEQIIESSGASNSPDIITQYRYQKEENPQQSSGVIFNTPVYSYWRRYLYMAVNNQGAFPLSFDCVERCSQSVIDLFDINGASVGYGTVTTAYAQGGNTVSKFTNLSTHPDTSPRQRTWVVIDGRLTVTDTSPLGAPFAPNTSKNWERGLLEEEKIYDKNAVLQKRTRYQYAFNLADRKVVPALRAMLGIVALNFETPGSDWFYVGQYSVISKPFYLTQVEEEVYDQQATNGVYNKTRTVTTFEYNAHLQLKKKVVGEAGADKQTITEYKYAIDYDLGGATFATDPMTDALRWMRGRHMHNPVVEQTTSVKEVGEASPQVLASALKLYARFVGDEMAIILPAEDKEFSLPQVAGAPAFQASSVQNVPRQVGSVAEFLYDSRYRSIQTLDRYNGKGKLLQFTPKNTYPTSYIWGYDQNYLIAEVKNAPAHRVFYGNFEENNQWDANLTVFRPDRIDKVRTGVHSGKIEKPTAGEKVSHSNQWLTIAQTTPTRYRYSGWVYSDGPSADIFLFMKRANESGSFSYVDHVSTSEKGKWVHIEKDFLVPADVAQLNIRVDNNGGGNVWFDDIRLHPADAQMTTYAHEPMVGITSVTDINNVTTYYEYDGMGHLQSVQDQDGNLVKSYLYQYKK